MPSRVLEYVINALGNVDIQRIKLSTKTYDATETTGTSREKYQERVFMYEFYHQMRCLEDEYSEFGSLSIQGEVNKGYQRLSGAWIPDLILHERDGEHNVLALECKMAWNSGIKRDIRKLISYRKAPLSYQTAVILILGKAQRQLSNVSRRAREELRDNEPRVDIITCCLNSINKQISLNGAVVDALQST